MSWIANQIYAPHSPAVMSALAREPFLASRMFLVDDLEGIRSPWTRDRLLAADPPGDGPAIRHGLPAGGLLAVSPHLYATGYDSQDPPPARFKELLLECPWPSHPPSEKWSGMSAKAGPEILFPSDWDGSYYPLRLLKFLKSASAQARCPIVYYWCSMWGGVVDEEVGWAFDEIDHIYERVDDQTALDRTAEGIRQATDRNALQLLMSHLGLQLPTGFLALHEGSFDWKRYWLADLCGR